MPETDTTGSDDRVRRRWILIGTLVGIVFLGWASFEAIGLVAREEHTVRRTFSAAELGSLRVSTDNGDVSVVTGSGDQVIVRIRVEESLGRSTRSASLVGNRLELRSGCPEFGGSFCSADYVVSVPRRFTVEAESDNGDVDVRGIDGEVRASSENGTVRATDVGGRRGVFESSNGDVSLDAMRGGVVRAVSENGDVRVGIAVAPRSVVARSENGDVRVELPRGEELYAAEVRSDNGETATRVRTDPSSRRSVRATSDNGDVVIAYG